MKTRTYIALLATAIALQAQAVVQILPAGEFAARDGRPGPGKSWRLSDVDGFKLAAELTATSAKTAFVFDYEHQTFSTEKNGQPAPAAAWATAFEWRPGQGLYATDVKWTERARLAIEADEYRYISPVIRYAKDGRILGVVNAAITNTPALLGMDAVSTPAALSLAATLAAQFLNDPTDPTEHSMNLLQLLIAQLGLSADVTEADALTAVATLKARADAQPVIPQPLAAALAIKADGDVTIAVTAIEALKLKAAGGGDAALTAMQAMQTQIATLTSRLEGDEVEQLVSKALADGKLLPATEKWARDLGKSNLAQLKGFLAAAPAMDLGKRQSDDHQRDPKSTHLNEEEKAICAQLSIKPEDFVKTRAAMAA